MNKPWTKEEEAILAEMWKNDCETLEIALALGRNRNSIIGKAHRLGLPEHIFTTRKRLKAPQEPKKVWGAIPKPPTIPDPIPIILSSTGIAFMDIGHAQCRAVIGRDRDGFKLARFCGHPTVEGKSWCPGHLAALTYPLRRS